ncbi:CPBP family glutamic-type intramembrane protease [Virgibacillus necropolis]|uniref:CAAX prenyl protease 2/Lysostaphin resistance protein A-like domain-containing protein n=1 Tax=Virgibacillus necropolis TaxID=163877 RepID=A0A221MB09_9BACI|nr:hypothetical protein CFK40_07005 [Virgibacillus necropolis]
MAIFHFITFLFIVSIVIVFIIGAVFGFIYKKTNSLWAVIIIHSVYNLLLSIFN